MFDRRSLNAFRDPASVAVVGASGDPAKWGHWLARGARAGGHRRRVYLVNRSGADVLGEATYRSIEELPETPELVVVCVPPTAVRPLVEESLARGTRAFLVITAGVPDLDGLTSLLVEHDAHMVGPNSLGLYDAAAELRLAWGHFTPGPLAIVSQSGQLGSEIANLAVRLGLGVSRFVSVGNQTSITARDLLDDLVDDPDTSVVALYLEGFADGAELVPVLRALAEAGKPTILLTTGASAGSQRLARSHTGSMTPTLDVVDAACRAGGAVRVSTPLELVNLASLLVSAPRPPGRRVAVVSDSGGQGGIAADVAAARGLEVPVLTDDLQARLAASLPAAAALANPIDLAGAGEADMGVYAELCRILLRSDEVDAVVLSGYLGCYGEDNPATREAEFDVIDRLAEIARGHGAPLVVHSMSDDSEAVRRMREHGVAVYPAVEHAIAALAGAAALHESPGRELKVPGEERTLAGIGYWAARELLGGLGVAFPAGRLVRDRAGLEACAALAVPVVLKAAWLEHKSEHQGVALGIGSMDELATAYDEMHDRLGDGEYVVEEQDARPNVVEMLVGARRDRDFGPVVVVGSGGTEAELYRDVRIELAPVDQETARRMIDDLRCRPLLSGWRGRPAVDVGALAAMIVAASELIAASPSISDLEINPVRVAPDSALAVDALVITKENPLV